MRIWQVTLLLVQKKSACLQLMTSLFRTLVDNKLDQLMMTFGGALQSGPPTQLPQTLSLLQGLLHGPRACGERDLLLELCLTLLARCVLTICSAGLELESHLHMLQRTSSNLAYLHKITLWPVGLAVPSMDTPKPSPHTVAAPPYLRLSSWNDRMHVA